MKLKRILAAALCAAALLAALPLSASAEGAGDAAAVLGVSQEDMAQADSSKPYLVLGADLSGDKLNTVLTLLGVANPETYLDDYNVYYTTNAEEYEYFGDYLDASIIGRTANSSILLTPREAGAGIHITTHNINYCTVEMYQNALITAGVSDVDLVVAGPFEISGTAALVSAMKAYQIMTGEPLSEDSVDAANNELVLTGELGQELGDSSSAAELIATLKNELFAGGTDVTEQDIEDALDRVCQEMGVTLSDSTRQQIIELMRKIAATDFDVSALEAQAKELFNKVSGLLDQLGGGSGSASTGNFFANLWNQIVSFFQGLFG